MVLHKRDHTPSTSSTSLHKKPRETSPRPRSHSRVFHVPKYLRQSQEDIIYKFRNLDRLQRERQEHAEENGDESPWTTDDKNIERNRYINIHPWNANRVRLNVPQGEDDYINASPIVLERTKDRSTKKYIATQGPRCKQASHLWRMIFEQTADTAVVVMLTKPMESGREKCYEYYPLDPQSPPMVWDDYDDFGEYYKIRVKLLEKSYHELARTDVRKISLSVERAVPMKVEQGLNVIQKETKLTTKIVWHLFFKGWPDWSVPAGNEKEALLELIKLANDKNSLDITNPLIVHCSAGVGRSGTFITLDHFLTELRDGNLDVTADNDLYDPVYDIVNRLREQRMFMVQSEVQFQFIYSTLREKYILATQQTQVRKSNLVGQQDAVHRLDMTENKTPQP